jgi:hypothetical protein
VDQRDGITLADHRFDHGDRSSQRWIRGVSWGQIITYWHAADDVIVRSKVSDVTSFGRIDEWHSRFLQVVFSN